MVKAREDIIDVCKAFELGELKQIKEVDSDVCGYLKYQFTTSNQKSTLNFYKRIRK